MKENQLVEIKDLFNVSRWFKPHSVASKPISERSALIGYFHEHARNKLDAKFDVSYISMILAHLKLQDLYYLKSICEDSVRRGGSWNGTFFVSIRAKKLTPLEPR